MASALGGFLGGFNENVGKGLTLGVALGNVKNRRDYNREMADATKNYMELTKGAKPVAAEAGMSETPAVATPAEAATRQPEQAINPMGQGGASSATAPARPVPPAAINVPPIPAGTNVPAPTVAGQGKQTVAFPKTGDWDAAEERILAVGAKYGKLDQAFGLIDRMDKKKKDIRADLLVQARSALVAGDMHALATNLQHAYSLISDGGAAVVKMGTDPETGAQVPLIGVVDETTGKMVGNPQLVTTDSIDQLIAFNSSPEAGVSYAAGREDAKARREAQAATLGLSLAKFEAQIKHYADTHNLALDKMSQSALFHLDNMVAKEAALELAAKKVDQKGAMTPAEVRMRELEVLKLPTTLIDNQQVSQAESKYLQTHAGPLGDLMQKYIGVYKDAHAGAVPSPEEAATELMKVVRGEVAKQGATE